jgi:hypothetical protein
VRNLSKESSKFSGIADKFLRANASAGVCDISDGARAYARLFEEQEGVLDYFVLPIDLRSFIVRYSTNLLDPAAPIGATPDFSKN